MIIRDIRIDSSPSGSELSADVIFESFPEFNRRVWFRAGPETRITGTPGDPLFTAFFIPAMAIGEDLRVDAPVSGDLIHAATARIQPIYLRWFPDFRAPRIATSGEPQHPTRRADGVACSFSAGLDSWYTFLRNRDHVTHLFHCRGFDRGQSVTHPEYFRQRSEGLRTHANQSGKVALDLESNLPEVACRGVIGLRNRRGMTVDPAFQTNVYFGSQLVATAHVVTPQIGTLYIANSYPYEYLHPTGSSPLTDPAWSTPALQIVHDGAERDRTGKVEFLARVDPEALNHLHVCNSFGSTGQNCNRCEKCVRTRTSLHLAGVLDRSAAFESPLQTSDIRSLYISPPVRALWDHLIENARVRGDEQVVRAIEVALGRRFDPLIARRELAAWMKTLKTRRGRKQVRRALRRELHRRRREFLTSL